MSTITALAWKEWREYRWYLVSAALIFIIPPFIEAFDRMQRNTDGRFDSDMFEGMVLGFGGLLAIILALAGTCPDLQKRMRTFWQSRPIPANRLLAMKYLFGLTVLMVVTAGVLILQMVLAFRARPSYVVASFEDSLHRFTGAVLIFHSFSLLLIYSAAFLIGCLVRQTTRAAMLAIAAGLLIYFLPVIVPALGCLSVYSLLQEVNSSNQCVFVPASLRFIFGMLALSAMTTAAAFIAVRRDWRLQLDQRLMCWMLGLVFILLFAATTFQFRSNIQPAREIIVSRQESVAVWGVKTNGSRGVMLVHSYTNPADRLGLCTFDLSKPDGGVSPIQWLTGQMRIDWSDRELPDLIWNGRLPGYAYVLTGADKPFRLVLITVTVDANGQARKSDELELADLVAESDREYLDGPGVYAAGDALYTLIRTRGPDARLVHITLANPQAPAIAWQGTIPFTGLDLQGDEPVRSDTAKLALLPLPELNPQQRLEASFALSPHNFQVAMSGDLLVRAGRTSLDLYKPASINRDSVEFKQVGQCRWTPLQRAMGMRGLMTFTDGASVFVTGLTIGPSIQVFDVRDPTRPRSLGQYTRPNTYCSVVEPLPDRQALLGSSSLRLIKLP